MLEIKATINYLLAMSRFPEEERDIRINITMHLAQIAYLGRTEQKLINADFYAYEYGGGTHHEIRQYQYASTLHGEEKKYLEFFFHVLKEAPIKRLMEIDQQDPAWRECDLGQKLETEKWIDVYKDKYEDINFLYNKEKGLSEVEEC